MHAYEEVVDRAQEQKRGCKVTRVRCPDKAALKSEQILEALLKSEQILEAFMRKPNMGQNDQEA